VKKDADVTNYMPSPEFAPEFALLDIVLLERDALAVILAANSSAE